MSSLIVPLARAHARANEYTGQVHTLNKTHTHRDTVDVEKDEYIFLSLSLCVCLKVLKVWSSHQLIKSCAAEAAVSFVAVVQVMKREGEERKGKKSVQKQQEPECN